MQFRKQKTCLTDVFDTKITDSNTSHFKTQVILLSKISDGLLHLLIDLLEDAKPRLLLQEIYLFEEGRWYNWELVCPAEVYKKTLHIVKQRTKERKVLSEKEENSWETQYYWGENKAIE